LSCHLCGDFYKNIYYKEYANLETHFAQTHHICPYEICKIKCYVAFKTEDELRTHLDIEHNTGAAAKGGFKANSLLGFSAVEEEVDADAERSDERGGRGRGRGGK